ncbi:hypothetical protein [Curtobacterium sp. 9128]|uniref:hypothetical protein n=1 Tax=Curtobacterium sp. 9128 TaxID=1793722 RepID=UPI0011A0BC07|nr:hypothetical protein [Curtobacterium sp. 9128]
MAKRGARTTQRAADPVQRPVTTGRYAVRPGTFNLAGELFTPSGVRLSRADADVTAERAAAAVRNGAAVVFESCGCGGGGPCRPRWLEAPASLAVAKRSEPRMVVDGTTPTWIDVWEVDGSTAVFLHGDVEWGSLLD